MSLFAPDQFTNGASSTVANNPLASGGVTLNLATGGGAAFPSVGPFMLLLGSIYGTHEYVKCTARTSDALTIVRAQESTTAQSWPLGTVVMQAATAGNLANIWSWIANNAINPLAFPYNAKGDGTTDDATALDNAYADAVALNLPLYLPPRTFARSTPFLINSASTQVFGGGRKTILKPTAGFAGAALLIISADYCGVRDLSLRGNAGTSAGSVACDGIQVSAARYAELLNIDGEFVNGWLISVFGTSSAAPFGSQIHRIHALHTAKGIHFLGDTGQNFGIQAQGSHWNLEIVDTGDCILVEDADDVQLVNVNGAASQGSATNSMLHLKGAVSTFQLTNPDLGVFPGAASAATVLIEAGTNGSPNDVKIQHGPFQKGSVALTISSGGDITFNDMTFKGSQGDGVDISGSTGEINLNGCAFKTNGAAGGTCYDLNVTAISNRVNVRGCTFESPVGSGAGFITHPINDANHKVVVSGDTHFNGSGTTPSNIFAGTPQRISGDNEGYNPRGSITPPTISALPFSGTASQDTISLYFTAVGGATTLSIGGTQVAAQVQLNTPYRIPARQTYVIGGTGTVPTIVTIAD